MNFVRPGEKHKEMWLCSRSSCGSGLVWNLGIGIGVRAVQTAAWAVSAGRRCKLRPDIAERSAQLQFDRCGFGAMRPVHGAVM